MTLASAFSAQSLRRIIRFFNTPKGLLILVLGFFTFVAVPFQGLGQVAMPLLLATLTAALLDVVIVLAKSGRWSFPSGAILTGLIIALVLRPQEPLYVPFSAAVIAIGSKHVLRTRWSNIFNPAAFALLATSLLFSSGQSWWGALPDISPLSVLLLLPAGIFVADRINKLPLVLVFLGAYFGLFIIAGFIWGPARVADVFRTADLEAALFFVFFMADDPPTCPIRYEDQIVFAGIVALASVIIFVVAGGAVYYLTLALLFANVWESARRIFTQKTKQALVATPARPEIPRRTIAATYEGRTQTASWTRSRWPR